MSELKQAYVVDGQIFNSKAEASAYLRTPKILSAMNKLTDGNSELSNWLIGQQDALTDAFDTGTIRRVSKAEHAKLAKALDAIVAANNHDFEFVVKNAAVIKEVFRWPTVTRMSAEEKTAAVKNSMMALCEGNGELADWVIANQDAIFEAYRAGVEKRTVSDKAMAGLAAYRAKKAAEKAAA